MRIIGIDGTWVDRNPIWRHLKPAFGKRFPDARFVVEEEKRCNPWEFARWRQFGDRVLEKNDNGEDVVLLGYSMGGIVACSIANRFERSMVLGIATIYSPHGFLWNTFTRELGANVELKAPIVTFAALREEIVWWGRSHPQSREHMRLNSRHFHSLRDDPRYSEIIAEETKRVLFPEA